MPQSSKKNKLAWQAAKRSVGRSSQEAFRSAIVTEGMPPEFMKYILEDKDVDMNLADKDG